MQRSRSRVVNQVQVLVDAAHRLIAVKGDAFTTQDLAKEAGIALQTFYRYFASKDELILAVIADAMKSSCERWTAAAADITDPLERVRFFIVAPLQGLNQGPQRGAQAQFMVSTHWRLHRIFPEELAKAEQPLVDLMTSEIQAAVDAGALTTARPADDAWFTTELVRSVFHYYAYAPGRVDDVEDRLWRYCRSALGVVQD
ncbi:helix-turn-helix domain-containing protein [Gordonia sp. CPCC 206044]|uniref:TetR/AcrR family transcriptional regulator n=1 Tax=Gordonia sp. CPCC 206044 TaxID=3140793 RepID=UPI003AF3DB01